MAKKKLYIELDGEEKETKPGQHKWDKQNLVTNEDMTDIWKCIYCNIIKKTYIGRPHETDCKKAPRQKLNRNGWWTNKKHFKDAYCPKCNTKALVVPKKRHSLSKFWQHKRCKDELLVVCPTGCLEDI